MSQDHGAGSGRRYPTEIERAFRAVVLGAALGFALALLRRRRG